MNAPNLTIRPATLDDIDQLLPLLAELFTIEKDFEFNEPRQRQGLAILLAEHSQHTIMLAQLNKKIVAMCSIQTIVSTAQGRMAGLIEDFVVSKKHLRQGIGSKLMTAIEKWAKQQGIDRLQLLADKNNQKALHFYKKQHWTTTNMIGLRKFI